MPRSLYAVVAAGLTGAIVVDLFLVVVEGPILHVATALQVSQWDASNALGASAFTGGVPSALLGLAMHLCVSLAWAAIYTAIALRSRWVLSRPLLCGTIFGVVVLLAMRYAIVPLGHAHQGALSVKSAIVLLLAHTLFFGIPVAYVSSAAARVSKIGQTSSN